MVERVTETTLPAYSAAMQLARAVKSFEEPLDLLGVLINSDPREDLAEHKQRELAFDTLRSCHEMFSSQASALLLHTANGQSAARRPLIKPLPWPQVEDDPDAFDELSRQETFAATYARLDEVVSLTRAALAELLSQPTSDEPSAPTLGSAAVDDPATHRMIMCIADTLKLMPSLVDLQTLLHP